MIAEGANAPIDPDADIILRDRGIEVVPDILGNAGGVVVSYFEWVQDQQAYFWRAGEVNTRLRDIMLRAYDQIRTRSLQRRCSLRQAAYEIAVSKVARATEARGIYP
jgi:glutamate dehydrogenase (NAD(P)+)